MCKWFLPFKWDGQNSLLPIPIKKTEMTPVTPNLGTGAFECVYRISRIMRCSTIKKMCIFLRQYFQIFSNFVLF